MNAPSRQLVDIEAAAAWCRQCDDTGVQDIGNRLGAWDGSISLDELFGLKSVPGQRSMKTTEAYKRRDALVREMAGRFHPQLKPLPAAKKISKAIHRYRGGADWRRDKTANKIPYQNTRRGFAWAVLKAVDTPLSPRRIRAILATSSTLFTANDWGHVRG